MRGQEFGTPFSVTATHATAAVASQTGVAGLIYYIKKNVVAPIVYCGDAERAPRLRRTEHRGYSVLVSQVWFGSDDSRTRVSYQIDIEKKPPRDGIYVERNRYSAV